MATVTVVRYKRRKRIGDEKSPMVYALKLKSGEAKIYSIETLAREIESIGSLSVEDVSHVMKSFVRAMKKVLHSPTTSPYGYSSFPKEEYP